MSDVISLEEMISCADREIRMREKTYPRFVEQHKLTQMIADMEIARMKSIKRLLVELRVAA